MVRNSCLLASCVLLLIASARAENPATVMTFNIRYDNLADGLDNWKHRRDAVAKLIEERKADVVGLQEVLASQLDDLKERLPEYEFLGAGRDDGKRKGEFSPLLVRKGSYKIGESGTFWLSESPEKAGSKGWDAALPRVCTWARLEGVADRRSLLAACTHFDHRGAQARAHSAELIRRKLTELAKESTPVLLMGDFNCGARDEPYLALTKSLEKSPRPFRDSLTQAPEDRRTGPDSTWNGFKKIEPGQRIDFIFGIDLEVLKHEIIDARIGERFLSDHLPVLAEVR